MADDKKARALKILKVLDKEFPKATVALHFSNPLQLLLATILSAQCTDKRVNMVTPGLFKKYKTAKDFAGLSPAVLEKEIRSTGFYRAKSKSIIGCCQMLVAKHKGKVPQTMEELVELPGVWRKTANCVRGGAFGIPGVVVDTHVKRLAYRMGLTTKTDPDDVEQDLMKIIPPKRWFDFSNMLIWHGRKTCIARKPLCEVCPVNTLCPKRGV